MVNDKAINGLLVAGDRLLHHEHGSGWPSNSRTHKPRPPSFTLRRPTRTIRIFSLAEQRLTVGNAKPRTLCRMSALGQKQTFERATRMSALPPKADILRGGLDVR